MLINFNRLCGIFLFAFGLYSCANVSTPSGGPKDETPPKLVKTIPDNRTINFKNNRLIFVFEEFIQLKNPDEQILISPPLSSKPTYKIKGKTLTLQFTDTLNLFTTYSLNFGQSILDLNEGNPLNNLKYVFSTGNEIDSSSISGEITNAWTGKPIENVSVFLYKSFDDSVIYHAKPFYVGYSDEQGKFNIENLKQGEYKIVAIEDLNRNYLYDSESEKIDFLSKPIFIYDNESGIKFNLFLSIPDKYKIESNEQKSSILLKTTLNKPISENDSLYIYNSILYAMNKNRDTVTVWKRPGNSDTIGFTIYSNDTLTYSKSIPLKKQFDSARFFNENVKLSINQNFSFDTSIMITAFSPIKAIQSNKITVLKDSTIPIPINSYKISNDKLSMRLFGDFEQNHTYFIKINTETVFDFYNRTNVFTGGKVTWPNKENLGSITLVPDFMNVANYIIDLSNKKGDLVRKYFLDSPTNGIDIQNLSPGLYTIKIINDKNKNGRWDTGDYLHHIFPEKVYNIKDKIEVRANWDTEINFEIP
jgi:uncharacterized protein (DUF2141 family)